jgi:hypothetical protein
MLSLLCAAALAEYDKCDRPAGKWAGFDQASKCQSMNQCASASCASRLRLASFFAGHRQLPRLGGGFQQ